MKLFVPFLQTLSTGALVKIITIKRKQNAEIRAESE